MQSLAYLFTGKPFSTHYQSHIHTHRTPTALNLSHLIAPPPVCKTHLHAHVQQLLSFGGITGTLHYSGIRSERPISTPCAPIWPRHIYKRIWAQEYAGNQDFPHVTTTVLRLSGVPILFPSCQGIVWVRTPPLKVYQTFWSPQTETWHFYSEMLVSSYPGVWVFSFPDAYIPLLEAFLCALRIPSSIFRVSSRTVSQGGGALSQY